jgi:UDP-N-acetylglucosamine 2-epimerase (non-hydrolysing)
MPEEVNRVVTDRLSDFLFAPSPDAVDNLQAEGFRAEKIHLVGNVMIDTLFANIERAKQRSVLQELGLQPKEFGLLTLHRPSNVDDPETLDRLLTAVARVAQELPVVFPVHPRAREHVTARLSTEQIHVVDPLGYLDFIALESQAALVLTDSGGVQEETSALGVPCITLRENTERPITVTQGTNHVVGTDPDRIVSAVQSALQAVASATPIPIWDGHAADRIARILVSGGQATSRCLPTDRP